MHRRTTAVRPLHSGATIGPVISGILAGLAIVAAILLAVRSTGSPSANGVDAHAQPSAYAVLRLDPRSAPTQWLLERLQLPEPYASRAKHAAHDHGDFEAVLAEFMRTLPPVANLPDALNHSRTVENYHRGVISTGRNDEISFVLPFDWGLQDIGPNHLNEMNSLRFLNNFMQEYKATGNREYLDIVETVLLDWIEKNPYEKPQHRRIWDEGVVGKRLLVLAHLIEHYKTVDQPRRVTWKCLLTMLYQHAEFQMQPETYVGGNHGMRQDQSLLVASFVMPHFDRSRLWRQTALDRLRTKQVEPGFSSDGVWKEHSPGYHYYVIRMLDEFIELLNTNGSAESAQFLDDLYVKSERYLAHVLTPAGIFPPVGDTDAVRLARAADRTLTVRYSQSGGRRGRPEKDLDGFFTDGGQVMFRDTWGEGQPGGWYGENAFYVHMHAASHPGLMHRHADELSFVMFGLGRWWISEGGKYWQAREPMREFVLSARAHNGYLFNGEGLPNDDERDPSKVARFDPSFVSTPQLAAARAWSTRFAANDVKVTRTYVFLRSRRTLILLDELNAAESGKWEGLIHLAPEMSHTISHNRVQATVSTHPSRVLEVVTEETALESIEVVAGRKDPTLGWISPAYKTIVPCPVVVAARNGSHVVAATVIRVHDKASPPIENLKTTTHANNFVVRWTEGPDQLALNISTSSPLAVTLAVNEQPVQ